MRRDDIDILADAEAGTVGVDDEGRDPLGAAAFAAAREDDVEIGDTGVRDPGLAAVEPEAAGAGAGAGGHRRHVGAGLGLGESEGGDRRARAHPRQIAPLLRRVAIEADRRAAEPLHGEGEIGEARGARQDLARQAERAHVEAAAGAVSARCGVLQQPGLAERADQAAHGAVHVALGVLLRTERRRQSLCRPALERFGGAALLGAEERPVEEAAVGHQLPSKTGFCLATKAR